MVQKPRRTENKTKKKNQEKNNNESQEDKRKVFSYNLEEESLRKTLNS